jgi:hypothetical protein
MWKNSKQLHYFEKFLAVFRMRDILVRIRIPGSVPLTNGSGSESCFFRQRPSRNRQKYLYKTVEIKVFLTIFAWYESRSVHLTNGSWSKTLFLEVNFTSWLSDPFFIWCANFHVCEFINCLSLLPNTDSICRCCHIYLASLINSDCWLPNKSTIYTLDCMTTGLLCKKSY